MSNSKITPLYERLSRNDELQVESNSISHQKQMLEDYARKNGCPHPTHFTDDDISGTRFDRPGFTSNMTMESHGPYQIACQITANKVEIPAVHLARHGEGVNKNKTFKDIYGWGSPTIVNILRKPEYLGHTVNFKTSKHFKDKKSHYVDESEWMIFENSHEAIVDQATFDNVRRIRVNVRRYPDGWDEAHPLTGLIYCADCGGKIYVHHTNNGKRIPQYTCSQYSKVPVGTLCPTQHRIRADVVMTLIATTLRAIAAHSKNDRAEFVKAIQEAQADQQITDITKKKKQLSAAQKRSGEVENSCAKSMRTMPSVNCQMRNMPHLMSCTPNWRSQEPFRM